MSAQSPTAVAQGAFAHDPKRSITPTTTTIPQSANLLVQTYTHVHPLLVLGLFRLRFSSLVQDPVAELLKDLSALAILQAMHAIVCLPPVTSGSSKQTSDLARSSKAESKRKDPRKEAKRTQASVGSKVSIALLAIPLSLVPSTAILTALLVLFGAPLTTHHAHTLLTGAHMSLLATFPLFYTRGVDRAAWWEAAAFMLPLDEVWGGAVGTAIGAWLGAVPIPLDWDRDWQKWPVTIVAGAYVGWAVGRMIGGLLLKGKRISLAP